MTLLGAFRKAQDIFYGWRLRRTPGVVADKSVRCLGKPIIEVAPGARIELGARVVLVSRPESTALGVSHPVVLRAMEKGAVIRIGADTGISGGSFCSVRSITIGERCLFGADVTVADTDFHPVDILPRRYASCGERSHSAVEIGDDAFIGTKSIVLKGAKVGDASVVGAASVVTGTVPPCTVAAGNPCRPLRKLRIDP